MPSMTIQSIVDRAAEQADMDGNFVPPETWLSWYGTEARALVTFLGRNNYVDFPGNLGTVSYDTDTGTIEPSFGSLAVLAVFEVSADNRYRRLKLQPWQDLSVDYADLASRPRGGSALYYSVLQSTDDQYVVLNPFPASGTYKGVFIKDPFLQNAALDQSVSWPFGFEEWIVLRLAIRALTKENSDTLQVAALLEKEEQRIEEQCWGFAARDGNRVRNVDRDDRNWTSDLSFGTCESWYWL